MKKMWGVIGIIIAVFILLVAYLFFATLIIEINSNVGIYRVGYYGLASGEIIIRDNTPIVRIVILGWAMEMDVFDLMTAEKKGKKAVVKKQTPKKKSAHFSFSKVRRKVFAVIKSFRVRRCYIVFDTGDMPTNGILYPLFYVWSQRTGNVIMVNFNGENEIILKIENSFARMLWALIRA